MVLWDVCMFSFVTLFPDASMFIVESISVFRALPQGCTNKQSSFNWKISIFSTLPVKILEHPLVNYNTALHGMHILQIATF